MNYIYTLSDSSGVRYVGKSNNIKIRYKNHIYESKKENRPNNYKTNWIYSLLLNNEKPIIEIIDVVNEDEWVFWEIFWISQFKTWGFDLVNGTLGGDNPPSFKGKTHSDKYKKIRSDIMSKNNPTQNMTDEWKKNISNSMKNKKFSEQHIRNLSKGVIQMDLNGNYIKTWGSASDASRKLNIHNQLIYKCCKGKRNKTGGFKWAYEL